MIIHVFGSYFLHVDLATRFLKLLAQQNKCHATCIVPSLLMIQMCCIQNLTYYNLNDYYRG